MVSLRFDTFHVMWEFMFSFRMLSNELADTLTNRDGSIVADPQNIGFRNNTEDMSKTINWFIL